MFWTGIQAVSTTINYRVYITADIDVPVSHTCSSQLDLPSDISTKQKLYDIFMNIFTTNQHQVFGLA